MTNHHPFWQPGSIVLLKEPLKPESPSRKLFDAVTGNFFPQYKMYEAWDGFTHGIIVEIAGLARKNGPVSRVALHLYDPVRQLIYVEEENQGIPTYLDYSVDELTFWKDSKVLGYIPTLFTQEEEENDGK